MSREFPDFVDPWKAADGRRSFQGTMSLRRMKRLLPLLAREPWDAEAEARGVSWKDARFMMEFGHDRQGDVVVALEVRADLPLTCQRSLNPFMQTVGRRSRLCVIGDMAEEELLPDDCEAVLVDDGRLALQDLVEDELLLALPQVPRDPAVAVVDLSTDEGEERNSPASGSDERRQRPFAGLAELLKEKGS